jgi:hypothetical protein
VFVSWACRADAEKRLETILGWWNSCDCDGSNASHRDLRYACEMGTGSCQENASKQKARTCVPIRHGTETVFAIRIGNKLPAARAHADLRLERVGFGYGLRLILILKLPAAVHEDRKLPANLRAAVDELNGGLNVGIAACSGCRG